jgi:glycerol kinase
LLWSPSSGDWSPRLLELFNVPLACLPRSVPTAHHYGLLPFGSRQIPLTVCTGDQAAVPFANGALDMHSIYINLGTGAFALAPLTQDLVSAAPLLRSVLCSTAQQLTYALEGTVNGAASALQWLAERSGLDVQRGSVALHRDLVATLSVPLFINGIGGIGSPYWLPQIESRFIDGERNTAATAVADNDTEQLVAVIESIAFLLAANIELMHKQLPQLTSIVVGGGLSSSRYLCECIADLSQLPVTRLSEPELTAKGLAYLVVQAADQAQQDMDVWLRHSPSSHSSASPGSTSHSSSSQGRLNHFTPQPGGALQLRQQHWRLEMAALQQQR